ncbi:MAG TPA: hypothetical protein VLZ05_04540, partial [Mycobacterium sp.]
MATTRGLIVTGDAEGLASGLGFVGTVIVPMNAVCAVEGGPYLGRACARRRAGCRPSSAMPQAVE